MSFAVNWFSGFATFNKFPEAYAFMLKPIAFYKACVATVIKSYLLGLILF